MGGDLEDALKDQAKEKVSSWWSTKNPFWAGVVAGAMMTAAIAAWGAAIRACGGAP